MESDSLIDAPGNATPDVCKLDANSPNHGLRTSSSKRFSAASMQSRMSEQKPRGDFTSNGSRKYIFLLSALCLNVRRTRIRFTELEGWEAPPSLLKSVKLRLPGPWTRSNGNNSSMLKSSVCEAGRCSAIRLQLLALQIDWTPLVGVGGLLSPCGFYDLTILPNPSGVIKNPNGTVKTTLPVSGDSSRWGYITGRLRRVAKPPN